MAMRRSDYCRSCYVQALGHRSLLANIHRCSTTAPNTWTGDYVQQDNKCSSFLAMRVPSLNQRHKAFAMLHSALSMLHRSEALVNADEHRQVDSKYRFVRFSAFRSFVDDYAGLGNIW